MDDAYGCWLAGLIDGEGCFRVHTNQRPELKTTTYSTIFTLKLRDDDAAILHDIVRSAGIGRVKHDASRSGNSKPCAVWVVDRRDDCRTLAALIDRYALRTRKARDFAVWRLAVAEWTEGPRGNRWAGPRDWSRMANFKTQLERVREYGEEVMLCVVDDAA